MGLYDGLTYENSAELCEQMSQRCDTALLAFSTGKDSIAAWLQMRRYFKRIIPFYKYHVPGLKFVEDNLKYYEDFFGCHIWRMPSQSLVEWISCAVYQPPDRVEYIRNNLAQPKGMYTDETITDIIRFNLGLSDDVYTAVGVRMADSPMRRVSVKSHGAINTNKQTFYPVYDWLKADLLREFNEARVKLPPDYLLFGNTFDGLTYKYLKPMREYYPDDYKHLLEWFPLAELDIARYEGLESIRDGGLLR